jgi:hypothetical protein
MARIITDGTAYANLSQVDTVATFGLGKRVQADSGQYVYGQASGAVDEGGVCFYEGSSGDCQMAMQATALTKSSFAIACEALADNEYGWFWLGGPAGYETALLEASISDNAALTLTAAAGTVGAGGTTILQFFAAAASGAGGLTAVRSTGFLESAA